jgi:hypothetical protein
VRLGGHGVELCSAVIGVEFLSRWATTGFWGKCFSVVLVVLVTCSVRAILHASRPVYCPEYFEIMWQRSGDLVGGLEITARKCAWRLWTDALSIWKRAKKLLSSSQSCLRNLNGVD